jgi:[ribosomal protein S5]-alanine N-acetyltransferase
MIDVGRRDTARLLLTRLQAADFDDLHAMHSDPQVMATLGGVRSRDETQRVLDLLVSNWETDGFGYWLARERASGGFAGRGGLRRVRLEGRPEVEVGYALMPAYWGRGLATELARESVRVAFAELGVRELVCFTLPINRASQQVMQRAGFRYAGDTVWADLPHVLYRLSAAEWNAR